MNKKLLMFGIAGAFALMLVSAALVTYLSTKVEISGTVSSPMLIGLSDDQFSVHGGETQTITATTTNQANVEITGLVENIVTSPGITCADFDSVKVTTITNNGTPDGPYDLIALNLCSQDGYNNIRFSYGPNPIIWAPGQIDVTTIEATFNQATVGTYTFSSQVVITP